MSNTGQKSKPVTALLPNIQWLSMSPGKVPSPSWPTRPFLLPSDHSPPHSFHSGHWLPCWPFNREILLLLLDLRTCLSLFWNTLPPEIHAIYSLDSYLCSDIILLGRFLWPPFSNSPTPVTVYPSTPPGIGRQAHLPSENASCLQTGMGLFGSMQYPLTQCLAQSRYTINVCWMKENTQLTVGIQKLILSKCIKKLKRTNLTRYNYDAAKSPTDTNVYVTPQAGIWKQV